jgi:intein/homing endonuclease
MLEADLDKLLKDHPNTLEYLPKMLELEGGRNFQVGWQKPPWLPPNVIRVFRNRGLITSRIKQLPWPRGEATVFKVVDPPLLKRWLDGLKEKTESHEKIIDWDAPIEFDRDELFADYVVGADSERKEILDEICEAIEFPGERLNTLLVGPPASLTPDERVIVQTAAGIELIPIADVFNRYNTGEDFYALSINPKTFLPEWKPVIDAIKHDTHEPVIKVKLRGGRTVKATKSHSFLTYDQNKHEICSIRGDELSKLHPLPILNTNPNRGTLFCSVTRNNTKFDLDWELGFTIGAWIADGTFVKETMIAVTNKDPTVLELMKETLVSYPPKGNNYKGGTIRKDTHQNSHTWRVNNHIFRALCEEFTIPKHNRPKGVKGYHAGRKHIPPWVFDAPEGFRKGLLCGYFTGDGSFSKGTIEVSTISPVLADEIGLMLMQFGIQSSYGTKVNKYGTNWRLTIQKRFINTFIDIIGFYGIKNDVVERQPDVVRDEICRFPIPAVETDPKHMRIAFDKARSYEMNHVSQFMGKRIMDYRSEMDRMEDLQRCCWNMISSIEDYDYEGPVYDLSVKGNENFCTSQGLFVHNSGKTILMDAIMSLDEADFCSGGATSAVGYAEILMMDPKRIHIIDEVDKWFRDKKKGADAEGILLPFMEEGQINVHKSRKHYTIINKGVVICGANRMDWFSPEFKSRFKGRMYEFPEYTMDEFLEIIVRKYLGDPWRFDRNLARTIGEEVWGFDRNIRTAMGLGSIAKIAIMKDRDPCDRVVKAVKRMIKFSPERWD